MTEIFDPYHIWLGIPPAEQPPSHYRLLALAPFEESPEVIENAADRQMAHVRRAASGKHTETSQRILNEISIAARCLLQAETKNGYDAQLRAQEKPAANIAATIEWTLPSKPPKPPAPRPTAKPPAPPKRKPPATAPDDNGQRWKGAPREHGEAENVVVADSPLRVAGVANVSRRWREKQSKTWMVFAVIGLLAALPVVALLIALATMNSETTVAQDDPPATTTSLTSTSNDQEDAATTNPLPLPGAESDADDAVDIPRLRSRRPWQNRNTDHPSGVAADDRDPLDDTPSFGDVELGPDNPATGEVAIRETLTLSAKTTMIQLALFRLPSATGTGVQLKAGQTVKLNITGQIRIGGQAYDLRGPEGIWIAVGQREQPATQHFKGAAQVQFTVVKPGELFLAVDDLLPFDNQGALTVEVIVEDWRRHGPRCAVGCLRKTGIIVVIPGGNHPIESKHE